MKSPNADPVYLDSASTTKVDPRVFEVMKPYFLELYGNASSPHSFGKIAKNALEKARQQVADNINCFKDEIIFTSGATESINTAIKGYIEGNPDNGNHIITVKTEHKAVLNVCSYLEEKGYEVTYLDVDENGLIDLEDLKSKINSYTSLISVMYVNNEIGVIQPIDEIGKIARQMGIAFFCDATQAVGKVTVDVERDNIDMLCFSGHKINGPKGVGVLYKKRSLKLVPLFHGGSQEKGNRAGTYNTALIVGLAEAFKLGLNSMNERNSQIEYLTTYLKMSLSDFTDFQEISRTDFKIPHIINIIIPGLDSSLFIDKNKNVVISNGSACNSGLIEGSHVLRAMLSPEIYHNNNLRISMDRFSKKGDVETFIQALKNHLKSTNA